MWVCKGSQFLLSTFTDKMISPVLGVWLSRPYTILLTNKFFFISNSYCFITEMHVN